MLALVSGIVGMLDYGNTTDALTQLLPAWSVFALNFTYALAGLLMFVGMGFIRNNIEAAGWALIGSGVLARLIALVAYLGVNEVTIGAIVLYVAVMVSSTVRIHQVLRGEVIVVLKATDVPEGYGDA